jgi:tetratricopeptide (TPR) repeat protein
MHGLMKVLSALLVVCGLAPSPVTAAQDRVYHRIDGRLQSRNLDVSNIRVRLLRMPEGRPITETFSRRDGQFAFSQLPTGEYAVETIENDRFEATQTPVSLVPPNPNAPSPQSVNIVIELTLKPPPGLPTPGVVAADVDLDVPKAASKRYQNGMKALSDDDSEKARAEFKAAIDLYPKYYAARLELGRELRLKKQFREAEEALRPLVEIGPKHAEAHIELGIVLLSLDRRKEAADELRSALALEESNWAAHLYLGWALLETDGAQAQGHFERALELDEQRAARAHLALARLAQERGQSRLAVQHLDAYVKIAPEAADADAARKLADTLRSQ